MDLRKAALNAELPTDTVVVPEWGDVKFGVKGMSIGEANRYMKSIQTADGTVDMDRFHVQLLISTVVDPDTGEQVFEPGDAQQLLDGPRPVALLAKALELAGLGGERQLEDTVTDLAGTPDAGTS